MTNGHETQEAQTEEGWRLRNGSKGNVPHDAKTKTEGLELESSKILTAHFMTTKQAWIVGLCLFLSVALLAVAFRFSSTPNGKVVDHWTGRVSFGY